MIFGCKQEICLLLGGLLGSLLGGLGLLCGLGSLGFGSSLGLGGLGSLGFGSCFFGSLGLLFASWLLGSLLFGALGLLLTYNNN